MTEKQPEFIKTHAELVAKPEVVILGKSFTVQARFFEWDEENRWELLPVFPEQPVACNFDDSGREEEQFGKFYLLKRKPSGVYECKITPDKTGIRTYIVTESKELTSPWHYFEVDVLDINTYKYMKKIIRDLVLGKIK